MMHVESKDEDVNGEDEDAQQQDNILIISTNKLKD